MSTSRPEIDSRAVGVTFDEGQLCVTLADGRTICTPVSWFPRLANATAAQRDHVELLGDGEGLHWPEVDEDLNVEELLRASSKESKRAG